MKGHSRILAPVAIFALSLGPLSSATGKGTLVVLNKSEATTSLIDLASGKVVATVPTGSGPHEVDVSPDGATAVVADYGSGGTAGSTLTVIDIPSARVVKTIDLGGLRRPHGLVYLEDGSRVAVTVEGSQALAVVNVGSGEVERTIGTEQDVSHMVAVTPDEKRAFVANIGSGSVSVLNLAKGVLIKNIPTGAGAEGITMIPGGKEIWITNRAEDTVTIIDTQSLEVLGEIESKAFPIRAKATPDGKHVLVSNARSGDVAVFDVGARKEVARIPMNAEVEGTSGRLFGDSFGDSPVPVGILISPDGGQAWVANTNADRIVVLDLGKWEATGTLTAGKEPDGLGYSALSVSAAQAGTP